MILTGNRSRCDQLARWFGVAVLGLNATGQMFFISACLTILAPDDHHGGRCQCAIPRHMTVTGDGQIPRWRQLINIRLDAQVPWL